VEEKQLGVAALSFAFPEGDLGLFSKPVPATHVGFGLTHVLPIVLSVLASQPGDMVIIENPEAHLHPAAQTRLVGFLARAAASGVQIVVETHSDHVLNSLRVAVKQRVILSEQISLNFFSASEPRHVRIPMGQHGELKNWPHGFFDEYDHALKKLLE
jgi:predicted ATPase